MRSPGRRPGGPTEVPVRVPAARLRLLQAVVQAKGRCLVLDLVRRSEARSDRHFGPGPTRFSTGSSSPQDRSPERGRSSGSFFSCSSSSSPSASFVSWAASASVRTGSGAGLSSPAASALSPGAGAAAGAAANCRGRVQKEHDRENPRRDPLQAPGPQPIHTNCSVTPLEHSAAVWQQRFWSAGVSSRSLPPRSGSWRAADGAGARPRRSPASPAGRSHR